MIMRLSKGRSVPVPPIAPSAVGCPINRFIRRNPIALFALRALHPMILSLKDALSVFFLAVRAYVMLRLAGIAVFLLKPVDQRTEWGFPKLIAGKLGLLALRAKCRLVENRKLRLERNVRQMRLLDLPKKVSDQTLRFVIADRLLAAEYLLQSVLYVEADLEGSARFLRQADDVGNLVNRELHDCILLMS